MVLTAFKWLVRWSIGSAILFFIGWTITLLWQGERTASDLAIAWFFSFNGIIAGGAGYGLVFFMRDQRGTLIDGLSNVLEVPKTLRPELDRRVARIKSWWLTPIVATCLTAVCGFIAYRAGIPLHGFAHLYLTAAVLSFYWVGSYGLMIIIAVLNVFSFVESHADLKKSERISLRGPFQAQDLQTIDLFFVVSSAMCVLAVYVCFRGTLTAFMNAPPVFYKALIIQVLFFLPASLIYSFYPRHVLREVWETDTFLAIERFADETSRETPPDLKSQLELRKLILDVKERMLAERRALPLVSLKDVPALSIALLMAIQIVIQKDPILSSFFGLSGK